MYLNTGTTGNGRARQAVVGSETNGLETRESAAGWGVGATGKGYVGVLEMIRGLLLEPLEDEDAIALLDSDLPIFLIQV